MFRDDASSESAASLAVKEVRRYKEALFKGFASTRQKGVITTNGIIEIQGMLIDNLEKCINDALRMSRRKVGQEVHSL